MPLAIIAFCSIQPVLISRSGPRILNCYRKLVMSSNDVQSSTLARHNVIAIHILAIQLPLIGRLLMSVSILACFDLAGGTVLRY